MHCTAYKKPPLTLSVLLLADTLHTKTLSLTMRKSHFNAISLFWYEPVDKRKLLLLVPRSTLKALFVQLKSALFSEKGWSFRRRQRKRVPRFSRRETSDCRKSVLASGLVGLISGWLSQRLRTEEGASAILEKATR